MENVASVVNIAIPNITDKELLNKIIKLSGQKLIKVLELGIIAYESMENQKQRWENSDFSLKIKNIESSQKETEKKYLNELESKNRIIKDLRREFSVKQTHLHKQTEESISLNYKGQLNFKDETIENITKQLKESQNNIDTLRKNFNNTAHPLISPPSHAFFFYHFMSHATPPHPLTILSYPTDLFPSLAEGQLDLVRSNIPINELDAAGETFFSATKPSVKMQGVCSIYRRRYITTNRRFKR